MAISAKVSAPSNPERQGARLPDTDPRFAPLLAAAWQQSYLEAGEDHRPMADPNARWRHSWAAGCARALGYRILRFDVLREVLLDPASYSSEFHEFVHAAGDVETGAELDAELLGELQHDPDYGVMRLLEGLTPEAEARLAEHTVTEPLSIADHWRFALGSIVHDAFQTSVEALYPQAKRELRVNVVSVTMGAGTVDLVIELPGEGPEDPVKKVCVEIKTLNGYGFKRMVGDRSNAEGPRHSSVVQLALNTVALDADEGVLIVLSMENLSPSAFAKLLNQLVRQGASPKGTEHWRRFCAEYTYSRDELDPIAEFENKRMAKIIEIVEEGGLPPRSINDPEIPVRARIVDPTTGKWELLDPGTGAIRMTGTTWHCGYCENRKRCIADGPS